MPRVCACEAGGSSSAAATAPSRAQRGRAAEPRARGTSERAAGRAAVSTEQLCSDPGDARTLRGRAAACACTSMFMSKPRASHTWARATPPSAAAPRPLLRVPIFCPERGQLSNRKTGAQPTVRVGPPAPHPAFKRGRGVSSNLSPPRPRTPPPPPLPGPETKGRARRVPPRGSTGEPGPRRDHPSGPPGRPHRKGAADKDGSPGGGAVEGSGKRAGGSPWEGPSGPGSAAAAGPGGWRARSASGRRAP